MKQVLCMVAVGACAFVAGCGEQAPPTSSTPTQALSIAPKTAAAPVQVANADERVVATVKGQLITMQEFLQPLIKAHGLPLLLNLVQLDLAKQEAHDQNITITPQDIDREQDLTMAKMFTDADKKEIEQADEAEQKGQTELAKKIREQIHKDRENLLGQYLENQHYTRVEYDLVIELNAYLRNAAERALKGKLTDEMVKQEFSAEYGQNARVRMIVLGNMNEVEKAQRLLKLGEKFEDLAKRMSRDQRTAQLGGEMPPFSRQTPGLPDEFKQLAFSLQPGQVSDPLNYGGNFYLIKLEELIAPKAVKFESVKDSLRKSMYERLTESVMNQLRARLGEDAMKTLQINDPEMARQFDDLKAKREAAIRDRGQINQQWKKERTAETQPTTQP